MLLIILDCKHGARIANSRKEREGTVGWVQNAMIPLLENSSLV